MKELIRKSLFKDLFQSPLMKYWIRNAGATNMTLTLIRYIYEIVSIKSYIVVLIRLERPIVHS